jgi:hypothetical protein
MEMKCLIDKDFDSVSLEIIQFKHPEIDLLIKPLTTRTNEILYGCYIPTIPRPTSILSGRILIRRLGEDRTELQAFGIHSWAEPFIKSLIDRLSHRR